jgi:hypothetical protein
MAKGKIFVNLGARFSWLSGKNTNEGIGFKDAEKFQQLLKLPYYGEIFFIHPPSALIRQPSDVSHPSLLCCKPNNWSVF